MIQERPTPDEELEAPRSFPVPRNRPVLPTLEGFEEVEMADTATDSSWRRKILQALLILTVTAVAVVGWLVLRSQPRAVSQAPVVEVRVPTNDPGVEIYFTPSQPEELPPLEVDRTPLPVPAVSLDELFGKEDR